MTARKRVAILISGRGSNMAALIEATRHPDYPAEIVLVIGDRPDAKAGLQHAEAAGVPTAMIDRASYPDKAAFEHELDAKLRTAQANLVCLAGFMRILSANFVERWRDRLINIHPSLLPKFPGLDTHARALSAGEREHGCSVHFVRAGVDDGPIVAQRSVPVLAGDTPDTLAQRVLEQEHQLYPEALALIASGRARVVDDHVEIDP